MGKIPQILPSNTGSNELQSTWVLESKGYLSSLYGVSESEVYKLLVEVYSEVYTLSLPRFLYKQKEQDIGIPPPWDWRGVGLWIRNRVRISPSSSNGCKTVSLPSISLGKASGVCPTLMNGLWYMVRYLEIYLVYLSVISSTWDIRSRWLGWFLTSLCLDQWRISKEQR